MKANELRIGNWVFYNSEDNERKPIQLFCKIDGEDIFLMKNDENYLRFHDPIPLTPELLEKLAYNFDETVYRITREVVISKDLSWIGIYSNRMSDDAVFDCPKFLHKLQNLFFALTGKELKINLNEYENQL